MYSTEGGMSCFLFPFGLGVCICLFVCLIDWVR